METHDTLIANHAFDCKIRSMQICSLSKKFKRHVSRFARLTLRTTKLNEHVLAVPGREFADFTAAVFTVIDHVPANVAFREFAYFDHFSLSSFALIAAIALLRASVASLLDRIF